MAHWLSDLAGFKVDDATGVLTDISGSVTNLTVDGGNNLIQDTGLGDANHTEMRDIGAVKKMTIALMINSTTEAIFGPLAAGGTSVAKTVEANFASGWYISGETNVGKVTMVSPVGLQTASAEFSSLNGSGFDRTSVAL